ncbi:ATP-binding protein [uncultured Porphyromonas sp.]|uniref:AAA family ATPase n=1 Tax=uncultured Porphyromonas sp. TaxID=159274 RepID=UPI00261656AF|nr:ATP-binding protein [uncultured Porphyromonas sp.]
MLLNFAVTNYRSIKERQVFSLMAVEGLPHEESLIRSKYGIPILPVALLFGANASGKSNILRAFGMMRQMVLNSVRLNPDDTLDEYEPFLLDEESRNNSTEFEVEFLINEIDGRGQHYRYGFSFTDKIIIDEWLYRKKGDGREIELFSRHEDKVRVNRKSFPEGKDKENTLNSNRLFLSLIAQLNGVQSKQIISWFNRGTFVSTSQIKQYIKVISTLLKDKEKLIEEKKGLFIDMVLEFLSNIDMGITELSVKEVSVALPKDTPEGLKKPSLKEEQTSLKVESTHNRYNRQGEIIGKEVFNIEHNESEGTQKITELLGLIFTTIWSGRLLVIDELDAKLHPLLTRAIVQLFTNPKMNPLGAQLVFTTHDTNQLHLDYVRRDEIWFTEKSPVEATELYSHIEFKDFDPSMDITEQYVNGRYGAIPRIKVQR